MLVYSTFLGGNRAEYITGTAVDRDGYVYVTGARNFPLVNAWQRQMGGASQDAFAVEFQAPGYRLAHSSYMGGTGVEVGWGIAVDSVGAYQTRYRGTEDAFVAKVHPNGEGLEFFAKLSNNGSALLYSTYYGSRIRSGSTYGEGAIVIAGVTRAPDFPAVKPMQNYGGGETDAFLLKYNPVGNAVEFSTPFGGSGAGAILNQDDSLNGSGNAAEKG